MDEESEVDGGTCPNPSSCAKQMLLGEVPISVEASFATWKNWPSGIERRRRESENSLGRDFWDLISAGGTLKRDGLMLKLVDTLFGFISAAKAAHVAGAN